MKRSLFGNLSVVFFIIGLCAGGLLTLFMAGSFQMRCMDRYEQIIKELQERINRYERDKDNQNPGAKPDGSILKEEKAIVSNVNRCVCCGKIIPEGRMVCNNCLRDEM